MCSILIIPQETNQKIQHEAIAINITVPVREAIDLFFTEVFRPTDRLVVATRQKTYRLKPESLAHVAPEGLKRQLVDILKKDTHLGSFEYRRMLSELRSAIALGSRDLYQIIYEQYGAEYYNKRKILKAFSRSNISLYFLYLKDDGRPSIDENPLGLSLGG